MRNLDYALDGKAGEAAIAVGPKDVRISSTDVGNTGTGVLRRAAF